jgi:hypothetical protein
MLLEATFDGAVAEFINHASINQIESADSSYPAGGYAIANKTVGSAAGPIITLLGDPIGDTGVTVEDAATFGALYVDTGTPATSRIYGKMTITGTVQPSAGPLDITPDDGIYLQVGG